MADRYWHISCMYSGITNKPIDQPFWEVTNEKKTYQYFEPQGNHRCFKSIYNE